ncbi:amidohydrolase [uncultured Draconibacterium sp.]|uniref:amidohydrolase n=1 Tax=uncultured Draconibacterium sp. TaxID=1573823 RepID=UPI003217014C
MKTTIKRNWISSIMSVIVLFTSFSLSAQERTLPQSVIDKMEKVVDANAEYIQDIYKDIHEFAELPFMEFRTAGVVERELTSLGFEVQTEIGITGVVGILRNGDGPVFMYRGDMDALSIKEETGLPYASKQVVTNREGEVVPVSHMCGHDANTTFLIGLAHTMVEMKDQWSGTLVLVAQPAEEIVQGAQAMIDSGLYTKYKVPKPDYFLAQHTGPLPVGSITTTAGRIMTGTTHMDVTFHGIGGHGSSPHHAKDPVVMAGMAIVQLQTVVSRYTDPNEVAVLTIGSVQAGKDHNVIPTEAHLKLKLHFSNEDTMNKMIKGIHNIVNSIALANDVPAEMMPTITQSGFGPAVYNDEEFINQIRSVSEKVDFVNKRIDDFVSSGSEDAFALINGLEDVKGAYLFLGGVTVEEFTQAQKEGKEFPFFVHEPYYHVSMDGITFGTKTAALIALDILQK